MSISIWRLLLFLFLAFTSVCVNLGQQFPEEDDSDEKSLLDDLSPEAESLILNSIFRKVEDAEEGLDKGKYEHENFYGYVTDEVPILFLLLFIRTISAQKSLHVFPLLRGRGSGERQLLKYKAHLSWLLRWRKVKANFSVVSWWKVLRVVIQHLWRTAILGRPD